MDLLNISLTPNERVVLRIEKPMTLWYLMYCAKVQIAKSKSVMVDVFEPREVESGSIVVIDGQLNPVGLLDEFNRAAFVRAYSVGLSATFERAVEAGELRAGALRVSPFQSLINEKTGGIKHLAWDGIGKIHPIRPTEIEQEFFESLKRDADVVRGPHSASEWRLLKPMTELMAR